jgi:pilus assembly protein Flp/PilA
MNFFTNLQVVKNKLPEILKRRRNMRRLIDQFLANESGATSIEYSMIAVLVAVVLVGTVHNIGSSVKGSYDSVHAALK